jgi:hypothetical protein
MRRTVKNCIRGVMAIGILLATASVGAAAPDMTQNVGKGDKKGSVHINATGVSGWAVVDVDGALARKLNAKSVSHTASTNSYIVHFNSNVRGCAYSGNVGLSGSSGTSGPGFITVVAANSDVKGVFVNTFDGTGAGTERPFHLIVTC